MWQWILFLAVAGLALSVWVRQTRGPGSRLLAGAGIAALLATVAGAIAWHRAGREAEGAVARFRAALPSEGRPGYVSSDACRACHPGEHATWHRSFHRTMTQYATPEAVKASFDDLPPFVVQGGTIRLSREGDGFWMTTQPDDPAAKPERLRIGLVTGSHHMQVYWAPEGAEKGNTMGLIPYAWLLEDRRWVPVPDTFLVDPRFSLYPPGTWNVKCLSCHTTGGQPGRWDEGKGDGMSTRVAELGIACESCHGPAEEHVRKNANPLRRYLVALRGGGDPTIVNPKRLPPRASNEACGQCHSVNAIVDPARFAKEGIAFSPGERPLDEARASLTPGDPAADARLAEASAAQPHFRDGHFWPDGVVRVIGREWSGVMRSKCFTKGGMTCLSCHSMHDSEPDDQLTATARAGDGDAACLSCHAGMKERLTAHTHHAADSPGSRCVNCHMPYTTYGLLKTSRAHFVDSPRVTRPTPAERPNACNLCHLDRSLGWTAAQLGRLYGQPIEPLPEAEQTVAAAALYALRGDAGQRAIVTGAMGWDAARRASGDGWQARYLAMSLADPYAAVRYLAGRALRAQPGFGDFAYDYLAPPRALRAHVREALGRAGRTARPIDDEERRRTLLMRPDGTLDPARAGPLLGARDNRLMEISE